ncbi:MAG: hypothetical protein J1G02_01185 [Clostridiales bacterium]|nr:hypothetical protein [Clostridiales bacterium]
MKKQDETIQKLFDDYAQELKPCENLAEKAKMEMVAKQAKPLPSARKKSTFWRNFAWITPTVAVFVVLVVVLFSLPMFTLPDSSTNQGENPSVSVKPTVAYYTYADVKGRSANLSDYDDVLHISKLSDNGYEILGVKCYAFFTDSNELRYVKVYLGVRSPDGIFTELELIGEVDGYVRNDLKDIYHSYSDVDGLSIDGDYDKSGEYVTQAYFAARDWHFYVAARNGQRTEVAQDILQLLA